MLASIGSDGWMMSLEERLVLSGVLTAADCRTVLELGYGEGGCTRWLSHHCDSVVTVDLDASVNNAFALWNVVPMQMTTQRALEQLAKQEDRFDLAIVDAGHDADSVLSDVLGAAKIANVLLLHDIFYPPTRRGAMQAVSQLNCWHNFDVATGYFKDDVLWGGIGIICPNLAVDDEPLSSSTLGNDYIRRLFEVRKQRHLFKAPKWLVRFTQLLAKVWDDASDAR
ncbi:MAG: class I SAM-dependent methyltransferase [Terrimicrobiaceae bacterium]|nr:class I SAM-dependent methyltransferase [Terrimicrobiaceae bacterium]